MQINQIVNKKNQLRSYLSTLRDRLYAEVFKGSSEFQSLKSIRKKLIEDTLAIGKKHNLPLTQCEKVYQGALTVANKLEKKQNAILLLAKSKVKGGDLLALGVVSLLDLAKKGQNKAFNKAISDETFTFMNKIKSYEFSKKINYEIANEQEGKDKDKALQDELARNRMLENPKVLYLASAHADSASDHKPYQGLIYVDKKWRTIIKNSETRKAVGEYIIKNNIMTFQWVIGKPVWFITRPNCRHYFKSLSLNEVLGNSLDDLLRKHKMTRQVGRRKDLQTIKHITKKEWYTIENVESMISQYEERLKYHESLYKEKQSNLLFNAIQKDKLLIKKWKTYLIHLKNKI